MNYSFFRAAFRRAARAPFSTVFKSHASLPVEISEISPRTHAHSAFSFLPEYPQFCQVVLHFLKARQNGLPVIRHGGVI